MEYISYILVILGILALVLFWVFSSGQLRADHKASKNARPVTKQVARTPGKSKGSQPLTGHSLNIPTPWGWPGHDGSSPRKASSPHRVQDGRRSPDSLHRFVDLMMSEKQTVENREYLLRKDASMRALLEDRFGRSDRPAEIKYRKVKAPLLRDPSEPLDQLDNFNSNEARQVADRLLTQQELAQMLDGQGSFRERAYLGKMKTPWGW